MRHALLMTATLLSAMAVILSGSTGFSEDAPTPTRHDIVAKSPPPRWESQGKATTPASAGDPTGRLKVKVKKNDTVRFRVESGPHGVIFENAKTENGTKWEVVSGTLKGLNDVDPAIPAYFSRTKAETTDKKSSGDLIEIRIKELGAGDSILFACTQHSRGGGATGTGIMMLGAIEAAEVTGGWRGRHGRRTRLYRGGIGEIGG